MDRLLKIADIFIKDADGLYPERYSPFWSKSIEEGSRVVNLTQKNISLNEIKDRAEKVFETGIWELYSKDGFYYFVLYYSPEKKVVNQVLVTNHHTDEMSISFNDMNNKDLYYPLNMLIFQWAALKSKTYIFHGCAFEIDGKGFIVIGESTAGKSTLIKTIMKHDPEVTVLNDEKNAIFQLDGSYKLSPTPWRGELSVLNNKTVNLDYIFFLSQKGENKIQRLDELSAFQKALGTSFMPFWDREMLRTYSTSLEKMILDNKDKLYSLSFNKDTDVVNYFRNFIKECSS